jgi:DNA-damage-inducible protein J
MAENALVQVRIDREIKDRASEVLAESGMTVSDAVRIMLTRTANENALPFGYSAGSDDPEYDAWFRAKVQEALDDPRPPIPGEEVEREFAARRAALKARLKDSE